MAKIGSASFSALAFGSVIALSGFVACTSKGSNDLGGRVGESSSSSSSSGSSGDSTDADGGAAAAPAAAEAAFTALEAEFKKTCGGQCHELGTYHPPSAPVYLGAPDAYKSIKAYPGIVVSDYLSSIILNKGAHEGPALADTPDLQTSITNWLELEAIAIASVQLPTTATVALVSGKNDIDLTGAEISGLTGVHLLFNASLVGGFLSLDTITVHAPTGSDVHVYKPLFYLELPAPNADMKTEIPDLADQFSNTDQTVPNGMDTILNPGSALFTSDGWENYDFTKDKIRITFEKLEPGKVTVTTAAPSCKNVALFTSNVLPNMMGKQGGFNLVCSNCHNNSGLANMDLVAADQTSVCNQVLAYLNGANIAQSLLITHVSPGGGHGGGNINDPTGFANVFTTNSAAFF